MRKRIPWLVVVSVLAAAISEPSVAQGVPAKEDAATQLEKKLAELCHEHKIPSLSIAVVRQDEVLHTLCHGVRKRGTTKKVEVTDRHALASNTKSMTATLAAVLVERGKIKWDTSIGEVWPKLGEKHLHPKFRDVTLEQLLSHQSGLPMQISDDIWPSFFEEKGRPRTERKRMFNLLMNQKPKHEQGKFNYSNVGYAVAAAMIERKTGKAYESLMKQYVFKPLKMDSADFFRTLQTDKKQKLLVWGHGANGKPVEPNGPGAENPSVYAAGGTVYASLGDYAKYAQWHLSRQPGSVLKTKAALQKLHTGVVDQGPGAKYGGGWIHLRMPGGPAMTHTGSNTNSFAVIWMFPDQDLAAIAVTNSGQQSAFLACDAMVAEIMGRFGK